MPRSLKNWHKSNGVASEISCENRAEDIHTYFVHADEMVALGSEPLGP